MSYVVSSSEKTKGIGAEFETKAMLYLMSDRDDSHKIYNFAIDFFNDVTGLDIHSTKAWDLQSKGTKTGGPKDIGRAMVTLFKNYMSELHFDYLILFLAKVPSTLRKDDTLTSFTIDNIPEKVMVGIKKGLVEESRDKTYINNKWVTDQNIDAFLQQVTFVVDNKSKAEYIKHIIRLNPKFIPNDAVLDGIFNIIRDAQSSKKNNKSVEGEVVEHLRDATKYDRIIKVKEIRLMVVNTLINRNIVGSGTPVCFFPIIQRFDGIKQKNIIEDCQLQIAVALSDKANTDSFWDLFNVIYDVVISNRCLTVTETYALIENDEAINKTLLDDFAIYYLISLMKEALG